MDLLNYSDDDDNDSASEPAPAPAKKATEEPDAKKPRTDAAVSDLFDQVDTAWLTKPRDGATGPVVDWDRVADHTLQSAPKLREPGARVPFGANALKETIFIPPPKGIPAGGEDDSEGDKKKEKPLTFRQREKRKREIGQASKPKNHVEEEKRILREMGGAF
eukprot:TRINITY_DN18196_c0_g1_i1.p1 TRINITY_DN18196_c0_g1~~TRINITY_DN18196_c0_g1_i1.p1  ORF type:complete len:173 (+),score=49.30 TRINITY_DN18196_c0_g1_i1:35-520(+)